MALRRGNWEPSRAVGSAPGPGRRTAGASSLHPGRGWSRRSGLCEWKKKTSAFTHVPRQALVFQGSSKAECLSGDSDKCRPKCTNRIQFTFSSVKKGYHSLGFKDEERVSLQELHIKCSAPTTTTKKKQNKTSGVSLSGRSPPPKVQSCPSHEPWDNFVYRWC